MESIPIPIITQKLTDPQQRSLQQRFLALGGTLPQWNALAQKYSEPHRTYHNLSHLYSLFQLSDAIGQNDALVHWAIFYHDAIYEPAAPDNEVQSAEMSKEALAHILSAQELETVYHLIIATQQHKPILGTPSEALFLDMDMAILAAPRATYAQYARAVRGEYAYIADDLYQKGRAMVLQYFLKQENIYLTTTFQEAGETLAHANIVWELSKSKKINLGLEGSNFVFD